MMTPRRCCLALALVAVTAGCVQAATPDSALAAKIEALLTDPVAARAHWGIAVTDLDGKQIYGLDETKLFRPASTAKLFTTAAAMQVFGPTSTVATSVYGVFDKESGTVKGDLELKGAGAPDFGLNDKSSSSLHAKRGESRVTTEPPFHDLELLANQIVARGVKRITGDIIGWDEFSGPTYPEGWNQDDLVWGYGAPASELTIADNQLRLTVTPGHVTGRVREAPTVVLDQSGVSYYTVHSNVYTGEAGSKGSIQVERAGPGMLRVFGTIAADAPPDIEHIAIDNPAQFAAMALRDILIRRGVKVHGAASTFDAPDTGGRSFLEQLNAPGGQEAAIIQHQSIYIDCLSTPDDGVALASVPSVSLADDIFLTNKLSQNLHAEILLRRLGQQPEPCGSGTTVEGARVVRAFLQYAGIDVNDFILYDGSGLSTKDLVTPRAEAQLLTFAKKQDWFAAWKAGLPVGGVDGTLAERFKEPPLKGHVFAKTGTLGESRALAGYLDCASGRQVIFSILVDNHPPGTSADKDVMDKIVAAIAASE